MKLYIMRHCAAVPGTRGDAGRGLTDQGRAQAAEMAGWLVQQVGTVGCIVTSTFARATETANIVGDILGCPHRPQTSFLDPEANPEQALDAITASANGYEDALVVTHRPLIGHLIEQASGARIDDDCFPHGSICHVERNELRWLVTLPLVERDREAFMDEAAEICDRAADMAEAARESLKQAHHANALAPIRTTAEDLLQRFFRRQVNAVVKALSGHLKVLAREAAAENLDAISLALPSGYQLPISVSGAMSTDYSSALRAAIEAGYDSANDLGEMSLDADMVEEFLRDHSLTKLTGNINAATVDRLRTALADAYESGADYDGLVAAIREEYSSFSSVRAGMIAQTEMNAAYNAGRKQLGLDSGMNEKSWNPDGIACPECMANVAEGWVPMDEPFASGDDMPPAHPNCDCSLDVRFSRHAKEK